MRTFLNLENTFQNKDTSAFHISVFISFGFINFLFSNLKKVGGNKLKIYLIFNKTVHYSKVFLILFMLIGLVSCMDNPTTYEPPILEVNFPPIDQYASWSPDGFKIIYYHLGITQINADGSYKINPDSVGLWIINSDGTNPKFLMKGMNIYADWGPNGNWIVFAQRGHIYKAPFNEESINISQIIQLTSEGGNFFPSWRPDGQWIVYDSNVDSPNGMNFIWKMKVDGTMKTRIAYDPKKGEMRMPSLSKEGNKIVHIRYVGVGTYEIFEMNSDGSNPVRLTNNNSFDYYLKYSTDKNCIIFQSQAEVGLSQIWIMDSDGSNPIRLTTEGGMWSDCNSNGEIVYTYYNYRMWQINDKKMVPSG